MSERERAISANSPDGNLRNAWWGEISFEPGAWGHWRVGPLALWVGRNEHDWQIAYARNEDPFRDESHVEVPVDLRSVPVPTDAVQHRLAYAHTPGMLELLPMLADRAVVARPESGFSIPPLERVSVFVSSAIWIRLSCGQKKTRLLEVPTWRPSDTWFGNNQSGFLCYATRTAMRLEIDELPLRPHRAVTPIVIDNQGQDALNIERISLPIPNLSVFVAPAGALWTERLHLTRKEDAELAQVHIERHSPPIPGAVRLSEPRRVAEDKLLSRVFTGLFA